MTFTLKGKLKDTIAFLKHIKIRKRIFRNSSHINKGIAAINKLSYRLHPDYQICIVDDIINHTEKIKTIRLKIRENQPLAYFRAGQYIVLETDVEGLSVSRPYSLSCSPEECLKGKYYDITVKSESKGLVSRDIINNWKKGQEILVSEPMGFFHYSLLRDKKQFLFFAGGSGITPFRSLVPHLLEQHSDIRINLFYGFTDMDEYLFKKDFLQYQKKYPNRLNLIPVLMNPHENWTGKTGFITREIILEYAPQPEKYSWFICGPQVMKDSLKNIAESFSIPRKQLRYENFTPSHPDSDSLIEKSVYLTVHRGDETHMVQGSTSKTIVQALEAAGLNPPAYCRSGECGWCRSKLVKGSVIVPGNVEGLRAADKTFGYIHTCSSYPVEDCEIIVNPNPLQKRQS